MKVMPKIVTIAVLCAGCTQTALSATLKIQMFKTDEATFKTPWDYQITRQKTKDGNARTTNSKKFSTNASFDINTTDFEVELLVYTGPMSKAASLFLRKDNADTTDLVALKNKKNVIALDARSNFSIKPLADMKQQEPTRRVSVKKDNNDKKQWTIRSTSNDGNMEYGSVMIKKDTTIGRGLLIPQTGDFAITVTGDGVSGDFNNVPQLINGAEKIGSLLIKKSGQVEAVSK